MPKKFLVVACLLVVGGCMLGYHDVHANDERDIRREAAATQVAKVHNAHQLEAQLATAWQKALASHPPDGDVDVAIYDHNTGAIAHYTNAPTGTTYNTASIIKLSILETVLLQNQKNNISGLTASQLSEAGPMIENSDNDTTTDLWELVGEAPAINNFFSEIGATNSTASDEAWGFTQTTALDQLKVVNQVAYPSLLSSASVAAANNLMDHVESDQRWGITSGVPAGVSIQLKDGWLSDADNNGTNGWNVNSVGHVHGDGVDYTIAVLTDDNNTEQDGINTIQALSAAAWKTVSAQKS